MISSSLRQNKKSFKWLKTEAKMYKLPIFVNCNIKLNKMSKLLLRP